MGSHKEIVFEDEVMKLLIEYTGFQRNRSYIFNEYIELF
jgi:hypothetical protein